MWLKIKVWTKVAIGSALVIYALLFIYNNSGQPVQFWWWFNHTQPASVFTLSTLAFIAGAVSAVLIRTSWKTYAQVREIQQRSKQQRIERDLDEMKTKAGRLQKRESALSSIEPAPPETDPPANVD